MKDITRVSNYVVLYVFQQTDFFFFFYVLQQISIGLQELIGTQLHNNYGTNIFAN